MVWPAWSAKVPRSPLLKATLRTRKVRALRGLGASWCDGALTVAFCSTFWLRDWVICVVGLGMFGSCSVWVGCSKPLQYVISIILCISSDFQSPVNLRTSTALFTKILFPYRLPQSIHSCINPKPEKNPIKIEAFLSISVSWQELEVQLIHLFPPIIMWRKTKIPWYKRVVLDSTLTYCSSWFRLTSFNCPGTPLHHWRWSHPSRAQQSMWCGHLQKVPANRLSLAVIASHPAVWIGVKSRIKMRFGIWNSGGFEHIWLKSKPLNSGLYHWKV